VSDDKTVLARVEVPGMQVTFQSPVGPSGKGMTFILGVVADLDLEDLNKRLDIIAAAARRQDAFEQLRLDQNHLLANRKLLAKTRAARVAAQQRLDGRMDEVGVTKHGGKKRDPNVVAMNDVNAVAQHDQRILEIEGQIAGCEERIPFWKAILRGEEPLDLNEPANDRMAAE
jgi:hypothetical protein